VEAHRNLDIGLADFIIKELEQLRVVVAAAPQPPAPGAHNPLQFAGIIDALVAETFLFSSSAMAPRAIRIVEEMFSRGHHVPARLATNVGSRVAGMRDPSWGAKLTKDAKGGAFSSLMSKFDTSAPKIFDSSKLSQ
jgi:hypothetical protein